MTRIVKEKRLKREIVYTGKVVDLFIDQVSVPDGSKHIREVIGHKSAVAILPVLDDGRILLIRQYRYAVDSTCWEVPAGLVDRGETPLKAARRECMEETGYRAKKIKSLGWIYSSPGYSREKIHLYLATSLVKAGKQALDTDEFLIVKTVTMNQALSMLERGLIKDGKTITAILLAGKQLNL